MQAASQGRAAHVVILGREWAWQAFPGLTLDLWPALPNELTLLLGRAVVGTAQGSGQETTAVVRVDPCFCTAPRAYKVEKISVQIQPLPLQREGPG